MLCLQGRCCAAAVCQELAASAFQRFCGCAPWGAWPPGKDHRRLLQPGRPCSPGNLLQERRQEADQGPAHPYIAHPPSAFSLSSILLNPVCLSSHWLEGKLLLHDRVIKSASQGRESGLDRLHGQVFRPPLSASFVWRLLNRCHVQIFLDLLRQSFHTSHNELQGRLHQTCRLSYHCRQFH